MTARRTLPNRRATETVELECDGLKYVAQVGRFPGGGISEIFLRSGKEGSAASVTAHDLGVTVSIGLQFGVSISAIKHALQKLPDGAGAGPLGKLLDLIDADAYGGRNA